MQQIKASLLISTYNWPQALDLVFRSLLVQTKMPLEVVIADDGSKPETGKLIDSFRNRFPFPIKHIWQEDKGFRKTGIMNQSVSKIEGDYIIQIDGDIILHPRFIEDHLNQAQDGFFIKGSRGMLSQQKSEEILRTKCIQISTFDKGLNSKINGTRFTLASRFFYGDPKKTNDLRGCNFAFWKKDFIAVNGYNNSLTGWGHEDIELAARMVNSGVKRKQLKMSAVCYHLYHKLNTRQNQNMNHNIYMDAVKSGTIRCLNGFDQSESLESKD